MVLVNTTKNLILSGVQTSSLMVQSVGSSGMIHDNILPFYLSLLTILLAGEKVLEGLATAMAVMVYYSSRFAPVDKEHLMNPTPEDIELSLRKVRQSFIIILLID